MGHHSIHLLKQKDFKQGTYRIKEPGIYKLAENIIFNPKPDFPSKDQEEYLNRAYSLGFFAAITVEAEDVTIDLGGHSLSQDPTFALLQRFYANIELANTPFIPGQGPANFGELTGSAKNCVIKNGILGRSSHHGIHGNFNENVIIKNVTIQDFEVAGIAINGSKNLQLINIEIGKNCRTVPVNSAYSAGRFLSLLATPWLEQVKDKLDDNMLADVKSALKALNKELDRVFATIEMGKEVPKSSPYYIPSYHGERLPDGNNYGLLVHVPGVAVNDYIDEKTKEKLSKDLVLKHVRIHGIRANVLEIVAISTLDGAGVQIDPSGSVFRILEVVSEKNSRGAPTNDAIYVGNSLTDAQIAIVKASQAIGVPIGRFNMSPDLVRWATEKLPFSFLKAKGYKLIGNGDSMFHVQKGVHGIRIDGLNGAEFNDVVIDRISNVGPIGSLACGQYEKSHQKQLRVGYCGADTVGINMSFVHDVTAEKVKVKNIHSDNGHSKGFRFINESRNVQFRKTEINKITTGYVYEKGCWYGQETDGSIAPYETRLPNCIPCAFGVLIEAYDDEPSKHIKFPGVSIKNIKGVSNCSFNWAWQIIRDEEDQGEKSVRPTESRSDITSEDEDRSSYSFSE